VLAVQAASC